MTNGDDGYYHFPISARITYVIRDNQVAADVCQVCKALSHYTVFAITGDQPTIHSFAAGVFINNTDSYVDACKLIDDVTQRARDIRSVFRQHVDHCLDT